MLYDNCTGLTSCYTLLLRLVCEDITGGQEDMPIPATNLVDDPPVPPTGKLNTCLTI